MSLRSTAHDLINSLRTLANPGSLELGPARWAVLARWEDRNRTEFQRRITHQVLDQLVETFDERERRVPVICAQGQAMSAHWADPLPPTARVVAVERDHINLWGQLRSHIDPVLQLPRFDLFVTFGFSQQSVGFHHGQESVETGGRARLWHLAQLSEGEPPGIPNMPRFDEFGFGLTDEQKEHLRERTAGLGGIGGIQMYRAAAGRVAGAWQREWRRFGGVEHHAAADLEYRTAAVLSDAGNINLVQEVLNMTPEELRKILGEALEPVNTRLMVIEARHAEVPAEATAAVEPATSAPAETAPVETSPANTSPAETTPAAAPPAPAATSAENAPAETTPAPAENTPAESRTADTTPAPANTATGREELLRRALQATRTGAARGLYAASQADTLAHQAVGGGEPGVALLETTTRNALQHKTGQVFQEVRTSSGTVKVKPNAPIWRAACYPTHVDPHELALLGEAAASLKDDPRQADPNALLERVQELRGGLLQ